MDRIKNNNILVVILSILIVVLLFGGSYYFVTRDYSKEKTKTIKIDGSNSSIVGTDPQEVAVKFIKRNGTMGSLDDVTVESLKSNQAVFNNNKRRHEALDELEKAVVPGSIITLRDVRKHIETYSRNLTFPVMYSVENIKGSKPRNERKVSIRNDEISGNFEGVDILVQFDSIKTIFTAPTDTSYNGTHTRYDNKENLEVIVTLVKSGDLWFVYELGDSEYNINDRFATWRGIGPSTIDPNKSVEIDTIKIPGIKSVEEVIEEEGRNNE